MNIEYLFYQEISINREYRINIDLSQIFYYREKYVISWKQTTLAEYGRIPIGIFFLKGFSYPFIIFLDYLHVFVQIRFH